MAFFPATSTASTVADAGCAYILDIDTGGTPRRCAAARRPGSSYCAYHHGRCHLALGGSAEALRMREIELLARSVGGRCARRTAAPSTQFLERLESLSRHFS